MNRMGYFVYGVNVRSDRRLRNGVEHDPVSFLYDREGHRKYVTATERKAFLEAARRLAPEVATFCLTLVYTGARISEALALTPKRIDVDRHVVVFETLKKRRRGVFRAVPVPVELLTELERVHQLHRCTAGVPSPIADLGTSRLWPWCRTTAWHRVKQCMELAGISGPQASPKGLRHGFGIGVLEAGVPINLLKRWLGHSRLSTTEIYADAVGEEERALARKFWNSL
jgi:integrase/recombinase XerD